MRTFLVVIFKKHIAIFTIFLFFFQLLLNILKFRLERQSAWNKKLMIFGLTTAVGGLELNFIF